MARHRSTPVAAIIVAIANLVLYIPCLCTNGAGAVLAPLMGDGSALVSDPKMKEEIKKRQQEQEAAVPNMKSFQMANQIVNVIGSIMMVTAAIGLLMKQSWGRSLCIIAAVFVIVVTLAHTVYQAGVVVPAIAKMQEEQMKKNPGAPALGQGFFQNLGYLGVAMGAIVIAGYPLVAIVLMMPPPVRRFYSTSALARRPYDDDFDREDDHDRRDDYDDRSDNYDR